MSIMRFYSCMVDEEPDCTSDQFADPGCNDDEEDEGQDCRDDVEADNPGHSDDEENVDDVTHDLIVQWTLIVGLCGCSVSSWIRCKVAPPIVLIEHLAFRSTLHAELGLFDQFTFAVRLI
ncbi:uncharacterized protein LOC122529579 [Frieseomelitta varia]|uniref:uncharacterized protein LOC122529579 n=1 Tax=Frieseomelitta varia TaxID=561572 RepID=UPI001CB69F86|nr:uncharacterized protein LOC122529579 [Frieseomelitta varia]